MPEAKIVTEPSRSLPAARVNELERPSFISWKIAVLVLLGLGVGYAVGKLGWAPHGKSQDIPTAAALAALPDSATPLRSGPWGNLEALPIYIEPPEEYLPLDLIQKADRRWRFSGYTQAQLMNLFQSTDLTEAQRAELLDVSKWQQDASAIYVNPSKELILSLSPAARKRIYQPMFMDRESNFGLLGHAYPADRFDDYFTNSGLPTETIDLVKKISFKYGKLVVFCDVQLVLDTLQTSDEKTSLLKALLRRSTLLLRLHITPESNLNELEHYWIRAGWGLDLRPMLESLAKLPHGARIDLVELLPPIPSADIYNYPFPSLNPQDLKKDCRWTSLNFFRDVPDDRFTDSNIVHQTLMTDYYPELSDPRYGDIVTLSRPDGEVIHLAVYIAADIVYTKNSGNFRDPFILMTMSDMLDHFAAQIPEYETLQVRVFRNKYY